MTSLLPGDAERLRDFLETKYLEYNQVQFIEEDPIGIPHQFSIIQDIEISALFSAVLAWGQRKTIISKCNQLMGLLDNSPYQFVRYHQENDLKTLLKFRHRTFNDIDVLYFIRFLHHHYGRHESLEEAFLLSENNDEGMGENLKAFHKYFFSLEEAPQRTQKHVSTPQRNSACKRLNMFLRWMVRVDDRGVDFGIWRRFKPSSLICPVDVHVNRVARDLQLITRKPTDWKTAIELTNNLKSLDPTDPVKYDFALFGLGIEQRSKKP